jgi:excinuclease UvrABC nuclease subunit
VDKIREASLEDLMQVKGISRALAEGLKAHLE